MTLRNHPPRTSLVAKLIPTVSALLAPFSIESTPPLMVEDDFWQAPRSRNCRALQSRAPWNHQREPNRQVHTQLGDYMGSLYDVGGDTPAECWSGEGQTLRPIDMMFWGESTLAFIQQKLAATCYLGNRTREGRFRRLEMAQSDGLHRPAVISSGKVFGRAGITWFDEVEPGDLCFQIRLLSFE